MKLLVVSHSCATATNQQLYAELEELTGWDLTLVIPADWRDEFGNNLDQAAYPGLKGRVIKVPVLANGNIILHAYRKRWRAFLREENPDAIYVNHEPYAVATAQVCLAAGRKSTFGFYSCQNILKTYPPPFSQMEKMVYRRSRFAFPITDAVAEVLREKGFQGETCVCALPLDPELYRPRGAEADFKLLPRQPGETVIGFVGRLVESKGLRTLAQALAMVGDLPWKLVLIGKGEFEGEFRALLEKNGLSGRAEFLGYVPHEETPAYLSAFDLLVLPSETQPNWKEQFGRVITEAMASETAVIGSDSGEIPHLINAAGGGMIFPERDASALAGALRKMMLHPEARETLAASGRNWVKEHVSLRAIAGKMAATIERAHAR
ncbi:glycosyltransferase [Terrimicrobium sacchariphilum]|uniref:Glycosyltransferase n=1 Tax=Terrimicrobium sacchariphilum TaxID=690879 RepID=A0A146GDD7_TERSA|nr:glycosyltransferase family 4 protein [Terrimicrobium sacchariphilum]GAT35361.1 glycosyltransferase [Terrimicrobium sacchariphilum]